MSTLTQTHPACRTTRSRRISLLSLMALYRQRRALAAFDASTLDDLGLTRAQADAESRRPFWDIPTN